MAWRRRADVPDGVEARLWLFGAARLVLANQRRSDRRRDGLRQRLASVPPPPVAADPADLVSDEPDPLWTALAALGSDARDLLIMRAWDELTVAEMAALLGCTPNAVSIRLHRARAQLARVLEGKDRAASRTSTGRTPTSRGETS